MDAIINVLVTGGYFRARITTLSDFDKIIGGMAWAMQVFSRELSFDVFYADSLDLGQKIGLTERLVVVLLIVKCPHRIEPHQIVGLDYPNLLPVLKWLIKRSEEVRLEHDAFNRLIALRHYHRCTNTWSDRSKSSLVLAVSHLKSYAKSSATNNEGVTSSPSAGGESKQPAEKDTELTRGTRDFLKELDQAGDTSLSLSNNKLVSLVNLTSLLSNAAERKQKQRLDPPIGGGGGGEESDTTDSSDEKLANHLGDKAAGWRTENEMSLKEKDGQSERLAACADSSSAATSGELSESADEKRETAQIAISKRSDLDAHKKLDEELIATNQKILNLVKKLDSMPRELEIVQYQRRYIELHHQLIGKNRDLKKLYDLYNSLDSSRYYLNKEINLLDSISANFDLTNKSAANRHSFLYQFSHISARIETIRTDLVAQLFKIRRKCDLLNAEYECRLSSID